MNYKRINIFNVTNVSETIKVISNQNSLCPVCKTSSNDNILDGFFSKSRYYYFFYLKRLCHECGEVVLEKYEVPPHATLDHQSVDLTKIYKHQFPSSKENIDFPGDIKELSPRFVKIYNEAATSENETLLEICGMGYRKALEFLMKDYLIHKTPEEEEAISSESLAQSINRIEDKRIKVLASRSAWLGNDECHYVRKHEDYGIEELKTFINAMLTYISSEIAFEKALEIPHKP